MVGVDGSLHLTVPSMNRLNQTEPETFSILPCWAFFRDSYFLYVETIFEMNTYNEVTNNVLLNTFTAVSDIRKLAQHNLNSCRSRI
jgi:hypothetical protein